MFCWKNLFLVFFFLVFCTRYILFHHLWKSHQCNWQSEKFLFEGLAPLEKEWDQKYLVSAIVLQFAREVKFSLFWLRFTLAKILYLYLHSLRGLLQCPGLCWYKSIAKATCSQPEWHMYKKEWKYSLNSGRGCQISASVHFRVSSSL